MRHCALVGDVSSPPVPPGRLGGASGGGGMPTVTLDGVLAFRRLRLKTTEGSRRRCKVEPESKKKPESDVELTNLSRQQK